MKLVAGAEVRDHVREREGSVYLLVRASRCCAGKTYTLEASTEAPERELRLLHAEDGIEVHAPPGLIEPGEIHLELGRRGKLRAFWNGQAWIG